MDNRKHPFIKHTLFLFVFGLVAVTACASLPGLPGGFGGGARSSSHSTTTESEHHSESVKVNGQEVGDDDDQDDDAPRGKKAKHSASAGGDFGATCQHNSDCASSSCFVGYGELGYCTKMCDSWSDCPAHWDCEKPGNAPQRICQQDSD